MFGNKMKRDFLYLLIGISVCFLLINGCQNPSSSSSDDDDAPPPSELSCTGDSTTPVDTSDATFDAPKHMGIGLYTYDESAGLLYLKGNVMGGPPASYSIQLTVTELTGAQLSLNDSSDDHIYNRVSGSYSTGAGISGSWKTAGGATLLLLYFNNKAVSFDSSSDYFAANGTYTYDAADDKLTLALVDTGFNGGAEKDDDGEVTAEFTIDGSAETMTLTPDGGVDTAFTRQDQYTPGCGITGTWKNGTMSPWYYEFFPDGTYRVYSSDDS